jgi:hypothetical protein
MSAQEQLELDVIVKISSGLIGRKEGQQILDVSERTLRRYLQGYQAEGVLFVKHGNCNRTPINRTDEDLKKRILDLVVSKYYDFNMTHCLEKLKQAENIEQKRETFRLWCHETGMVKRAKRRSSKVRRQRTRMQQTGLMLQMDGSPHHWFGGKPSCLIGAIDDADGDVPFAEFFPAEDTISCMRVLEQIVRKVGLFHILYVDKAGIFGGQKRSNFSQVKRALKELGIHIIFAHSPEAKGRIERLWNTLQDRLIPEMRIRNIQSYEVANCFLQEQFLPNEYAPKFKVQPGNLQTAYKPIPNGIDLHEIFCLKEDRSVNRDHTYSWNNELYRIESSLKHSIWKQKIEIRTYQDLSWKVFFAGRELHVSLVNLPEKQSVIAAPELPPEKILPLDPQRVRCDGHVGYLNRYYSVDEQFVEQRVTVLEKDSEIRICHRGKLIETHAKLTGEYSLHSTKPEHLGPWKRAMEPASVYRKAAKRIGPQTDELIQIILNRGQGFIDTSSIWGIIGFQKSYSTLSINEACKQALEMESPNYRAVKVFLRLIGNRYEQQKTAMNA